MSTCYPKAFVIVGKGIGMWAVGLSLTSGCASMKTQGEWLNSDSSPAANQTQQASFMDKVGRTTQGLTGQVKSVGAVVGSAVGKAKNAVANTFTPKAEDEDPTSLANMPTNLGPEIWVTNGQLYESQGNFSKALDNYSKALEIEPKNQAALLSTARLYVRQKKFDQASEFFNKALAVSPDAGIYNELAMAKNEQGKSAEAEAAAKQAIAMEPSNARFRNNLASMLVETGRSDEAVRQLKEIFPPAVANYNVAFLHFNNQNMAGAQQHLQVALQQDPNLQQARDLLAKLEGNPSIRTAMSAYDTASQIYKSASQVSQATASSGGPATGYQPPPATQSTAPSGSYSAYGGAQAASSNSNATSGTSNTNTTPNQFTTPSLLPPPDSPIYR